MDRLTLQETVCHEGRDFFGRRAAIMLSPNTENTGWVWDVEGRYIPITPDIMVSKPRRIALQYAGHVFNEFEHIGILRAAGLQHVRIRLLTKHGWPPYDGGSFAFWQAVMPHVHKDGWLKPFLAQNGTYMLPIKRGNKQARFVEYYGDGNDRDILCMTGLVEFPRIQNGVYRFGHVYPQADLRPLVRARTLGWPPELYYLSKTVSMLGWPHHKRINWPQEAKPAAVLDWIGRHRMLDALAILNFLAPTGTYLAGAFHSCKGNHATDVALVQKLWAGKIVSIGTKVA